ncbi:DUF2158 domain-containing protein [Pseudomonas mediterranea]|uniref:Uncharacterized small protein n=1 Tax=Pseudomonas mediterranea TaxID=183795 RepID=A0AAX2DEU3_9PSED|nr:DUF2158 domain-containing protein [Pseudomonas mediterranea]KGU87219.1 hypothetical protein N005_01295 [Pseudomonas mediterranea CFBP 5447]SDU61752.1 Uncharacterized small protein [Pseudomonas mediterranea]
MSGALKLGDVVRYKLNNQLMTVIDAGPVNVGGALGVTARMVVPQTLSHDHVECKWFEKSELHRKILKKVELEFVSSTEMYHPKEGEMVELASGGPRMIVNRCGPKDFSVGALGIGGRVVRNTGSVRHDLVGCKWIQGKSESKGEFEIGTVKPI